MFVVFVCMIPPAKLSFLQYTSESAFFQAGVSSLPACLALCQPALLSASLPCSVYSEYVNAMPVVRLQTFDLYIKGIGESTYIRVKENAKDFVNGLWDDPSMTFEGRTAVSRVFATPVCLHALPSHNNVYTADS